MDYIYGRREEPLNGIMPDTPKESFMLKALSIQKMIEQGNVTPLKDLHRRFISDCKNKGYKVTEFQDEITIDVPLSRCERWCLLKKKLETSDETND